MNRRAGAYLRYSSAAQREASLEDQLRNCERYVQTNGDKLLSDFVERDAAVSGTSLAGREGLKRLLSRICVKPAPIDYLVVDDLSRLTRDVADAMGLFKKLRYFGIELIGIADGMSSRQPGAKIGFTFKAVMNEIHNDDLAAKTLRGLEGQALKGRSTGGRCYGYRSVAEPGSRVDLDGNPISDGKRLVVFEPEAQWVRRIFALGLEGKNPRAIVNILVKEGAPPPKHGSRSDWSKGWSYSTVRAILRNTRYSGRITYKKRQFQKDLSTGKRGPTERPPEEWVEIDVPELAIVSDEDFDKLQVLLDLKTKQFDRGADGRVRGREKGVTVSEYLLSGILVCGCCGARLTIYGGGKRNPNTGRDYRGYVCPSAGRRGEAACTNRTTISRIKIEDAVIGELETKLLNPSALAFFTNELRKAFEEERKSSDHAAAQDHLRQEVVQLEKGIQNLIEQLKTHGPSTWVSKELRESEQRHREARERLGRLERLAQGPGELPDEAIKNCLGRLRDTLRADPVAARQLLKALVGELTLTPKIIEEEGSEPAKKKSRPTTYYVVSGSAFLRQVLVPLGEGPVLPSVVAGAGFEPATFGL